MFKLKKSLFLFLILPFVLWACSSTEEPVAVEPAAVEEEVESSAETMTEDEEMSEDDHEMTEDEEMDDEESSEIMAEEMANVIYTVDTAASSLAWTGAKAVGDSHSGTINLLDGQLVGNGDTFVSGKFNIDMTSIADVDGNARLEGHLKSDDFFGVETFPTASLEILSATPNGDGGYDVVANLTMKDITNELTFPATVDIADGTLSGTASIVFDRALWDVRYGSGSFFSDLGNDLINDEIELEVTLVANG